MFKRNIDETRKFYQPANDDMRNLALRERNRENFKRYERKRRALAKAYGEDEG